MNEGHDRPGAAEPFVVERAVDVLGHVRLLISSISSGVAPTIAEGGPPSLTFPRSSVTYIVI